MEIPKPPPEVARAGLRALLTVALADGEFQDLERRFIEAVRDHVLGADVDLDGLAPIDPDELARSVPEPFRERLVHGCLLVALIDGEASEPELTLLNTFAAALDVRRDAIKTAQKLADQSLLSF